MSITDLTRRRLLQASAAAGAASFVLPVTGHASETVPRIRANGDPQYMDPFNQIGGIEEYLKITCLVTLMRFSGSGTTAVEPYAAREIEWISDRDVRFVLHEGIVWSGGYGTVSAEDVKYSFERIGDPEAGSPWQYTWSLLDHVEVVDELTGIIHLTEPFAPLFSSVLTQLGGHILCRKAMEDVGGTFTTEFPAQCGPYRMTEWQPEAKVVLERNPDWILPKPDFDGFEFIIVSDGKTAELAYEAGELDYTLISVDSIARYQESLPENSALFEAPSIDYSWLGMNTDHPKLADIRVRKAIQYAVDIQMILDGAYGGLAAPATGIQAPGTVGYREQRQIAQRDVDMARSLLEEAGVSGLELTLTCLNDTVSQSVCQIVQANLADVGITVDILVYDAGVYWNLGLESEGDDWKDLQLTLMPYSGGVDPSENLVWFLPDQVGVWNWERWNSPEFGALYDKAMVELDPEARYAMYVEMQDLMEESGAYHFITHGVNAALHRDWMEPSVRLSGSPQLPQFRKV